MGKKLSPGFRFHPTDVELVMYHLKRKVLGKKFHMEAIAEVDIYKYSPWDLPAKSLLRTGDLKWYFFCPREKKYASGSRTKRATECGYWKTTGKDRAVRYNDKVVGNIKTLVFHSGKAPKGDRTDWVMYEYKLEDKELADRGVFQDSFVLCSIFKKDGPGPKNGAQYGAPFKEEDWDDDDDDEGEEVVVNGAEIVPSAVDVEVQVNQNSCIATTSLYVSETERASTLLCPSENLVSDMNICSVVADDFCVASSKLPDAQDAASGDGDIIALLGDSTGNNAEFNDFDVEAQQIPESNQVSDGLDVYAELGDLFDGHNVATRFSNGQYLELMDLEVPLNFSDNEVQAGGFENSVQPFFGWDDGDGKRASGYYHTL